MKIALTLILLGLLSLAFISCQRGNDRTSGGPRIALVMNTANNPFFIEMQKGAEAAAKKLGVNLIVQAAEREVDVEKQMQIVENLIQAEVAALCITPSGSREIVPVIEKANRAGIPVLIVIRREPEHFGNEREDRDLHRLGQLRGRQDRRRLHRQAVGRPWKGGRARRNPRS